MDSKTQSFCIFIGMSWNKGAISQQFQAIIEELVNRGHQVVVLMDHQKKNFVAPDSNPALYTWPSSRPTHLRDAWFLQKLIWKYQPQCMIGQFGSANLLLSLGWLNRIPCRISWFHSIHIASGINNLASYLNNKIVTIRKKVVFKMATHVVGVSKAACQFAHKIYDVPHQKISTMYNFLRDPIDNLDETDTPNKYLLTCASRLVPEKGQDTLIEALVHVKEIFPSITVEFLGSGYAMKQYKQLAYSLNVDDICIFLGQVDYPILLKKLKQSWISIFPSRADAMPFVAIESLGVGTPVIASNIGGLPEIITNGEEGYLIPPDNPEILSEKISIILSNENLRTKMSENARRKFIGSFSEKTILKDHASKIENFISESLYT